MNSPSPYWRCVYLCNSHWNSECWRTHDLWQRELINVTVVMLISTSMVCAHVCVCLCVHVCTHLSVLLSAFVSIWISFSTSTHSHPHSHCIPLVQFLVQVGIQTTRWWSLKVGGKRNIFGCDFSAAMQFRTKSKTLPCDWQSSQTLSTIYFSFQFTHHLPSPEWMPVFLTTIYY